MYQQILAAMQSIQQSYQHQTNYTLPNLEITLSQIANAMGHNVTGCTDPFYTALEYLEQNSFIADLSTSNSGFGRVTSPDGFCSASLGAKIIRL